MSTKDAEVIARLCTYYVQNTVITFEEEPVSSEEMADRISEVPEQGLPWLVAEVGNDMVGRA